MYLARAYNEACHSFTKMNAKLNILSHEHLTQNTLLCPEISSAPLRAVEFTKDAFRVRLIVLTGYQLQRWQLIHYTLPLTVFYKLTDSFNKSRAFPALACDDVIRV